MVRKRPAAEPAVVAEVPNVDGMPAATAWAVDVDPAFKQGLEHGTALMEFGMFFKPMVFRLANTGPATALDIELVPQDEHQQFEGRRAWPSLEADQWVRFTVNRQFFTDNSVRLQWRQADGDGRYFTTIWLPAK